MIKGENGRRDQQIKRPHYRWASSPNHPTRERSPNFKNRRRDQQTYLIREGEVEEFMFFIVEGEVEIRLTSHGPQQVAAVYSADSTVGEMSLLDDYTRSAMV